MSAENEQKFDEMGGIMQGKLRRLISVSELKQNQAYVQQISEVIAAVLEFEVAIIDNKMEVIAGTGKYKEEIGTVYGIGSITGHIITNGGNYVLDKEPLKHSICKDCDERNICKLKAAILTPIILHERVIGTISLFAFDEGEKTELLVNQDKLLDFLMKIAALTSSKVGETEMHYVEVKQSGWVVSEVKRLRLALLVSVTFGVKRCNKQPMSNGRLLVSVGLIAI